MKKFLVFAIIVGVAYYWYSSSTASVTLGDGIKAPILPKQIKTSLQSFYHQDYEIIPLYEFDLEAKVLSKKRSHDHLSDIAPIDIAFGWNQMSDEAVLRKISIWQRGRWYYWKTPQFPIPRKQIESSSANMHLIYANDEVRQAIFEVKEGQIVKLSGELVQVKKEGRTVWKSSTTRKDTGDGACEVIYVRAFTIAGT